MVILGLNAFHGDASAAIFVDGQLIAAAEEERFTRVKHTAGFPAAALRYCLAAAAVEPRHLDIIAVARRRRARLLQKAWRALRMPGAALNRTQAWREFGTVAEQVAAALDVDPASLRAEVRHVEHHVAHIASAFFVSPFDRAALLSLDGFGDFASGMWGLGEGSRLQIWGDVGFPHSLGLAYTGVTQHLGFRKYGDEYKVMGLAAYGRPTRLDDFRRLIRMRDGLGYTLDLRYFRHHRGGGAPMTWAAGEPQLSTICSDELERLFGPTREPGAAIEDRHADLASSLQRRTEEVAIQQWNALHRLVTQRTSRATDALAYAGGVAYNCVANGRVFDTTPFKRFYAPPAAGDAGLAVGAAAYVWHHDLQRPRSFVMDHAYWGPSYDDRALCRAIESRRDALQRDGCRIQRLDHDDELCRWTAARIAEGAIVGWFQGRGEWGARALGNRSILVDPRRADMKDVLNQRIKLREPFRPFAPSVLEEAASDYFDRSDSSPFMLMTYRVRDDKRAVIPAPTHVDGTARVQTVSRATNPRYWRLIDAFGALTGVPVLLNTSFNENEPVVDTPEQALDCFLRTRMDVLALGPFAIERPSRRDDAS